MRPASILEKTKLIHNNNITLKQNKTIAEWFALFDKESTDPAACSSSSSAGCPAGFLSRGAAVEDPAKASLSTPSAAF